MPISTQCANGHRLQVETMLAGKRIRCKKCGDIFVVPQPSQVDQPSTRTRLISEDTAEPRSIKGELIPVGFPELKLPKPKQRGSVWPSKRIDKDNDVFDDPGSARSTKFNRGEFEQLDFLFEHHPLPVARRYSVPISILILLLPLLIYGSVRFVVSSLPPAYLAEVKRLAVHHANLETSGRLKQPKGNSHTQSAESKITDSIQDQNAFLIRDVCLLAAGKYLATYHAPVRQTDSGGYVRVMDLQTRQEIGTIRAPGPHVSLAGSLDTLVVGGWGSSSLKSYQIPSLQLIQQKLVSPETSPISLAMGHSSHGPLYVINSESRLEIRDLANLDQVPHLNDLDEARLLFDKRSLCNASADGEIFCAQGSHLNIVQFSRGRVRGEGQSTVFASDHVAPTLSADGKQIFTPRGIYASSLAISDYQRRSCLAAASGPFFVGPSTRTKSELNKLWLYASNHDEPIAEIPREIASPLAIARNSIATQTLTNDKRLILVPTQNCIVTIGPESDRAVIHEFNFDDALTAAGLRVPYIASVPVMRSARGQTLTYRVETKGFQTPSFRLSLAPPGMRIDQEGEIRWLCNQPEGTSHRVVVDVREDALHAIQSFEVLVGGMIMSERRNIVMPMRKTERIRSEMPESDAWMDREVKNSEKISRVDLPGIARQPTLAGDGRFLIVRILEIDSLAIIDLLHPSAVRYLPIPSSSIFAASKSKIVTFDLALQQFERFDLRTLQSLGTGRFPEPPGMSIAMTAQPDAPETDRATDIARLLMTDGESDSSAIQQIRLSIGFRSEGPMLYSDRSQGLFIDVDSFQAIGQAATTLDCLAFLSSRWGFRMLPHGDSFVGAYDYESPLEIRGGYFDGETISYHTPMAYPSPISQAYPGMILMDDAFPAAVTKQVTMGVGDQRRLHLAVPSADHVGYIAVEITDSRLNSQLSTDIFLYDDSEFHRPKERNKLITLLRKDIEPPPADRREYRGFLPWDQRVIHLPRLNLLVTLPTIGNRVVIAQLDEPSQRFASVSPSKRSASQSHVSPFDDHRTHQRILHGIPFGETE